jgi:hypothetical protein
MLASPAGKTARTAARKMTASRGMATSTALRKRYARINQHHGTRH